MTQAAMRRLAHPDCRHAPGVGSLTLRPRTFPCRASIVDPATFVVAMCSVCGRATGDGGRPSGHGSTLTMTVRGSLGSIGDRNT